MATSIRDTSRCKRRYDTIICISRRFAGQSLGPAITNRVEHLSFVDPADIPRFHTLGVIASMQPIFLGYRTAARFTLPAALGPERIRYAYAFGSVAASGAPLRFGSDAPSSPTSDPIAGMHLAVTRTFGDGTVQNPAERVAAPIAFAAYTGRFATGELADLVLWSKDPSTGRERSVAENAPKMVFVGGRQVL
jgi:predicted amidohydrolase YtcJ